MTLELAVREAASILAPAVKDADNKASRDIFGTAIVSASGAKVMLDGAASPVGCSFSVNCLDGDRVVCHIVNHRVVVFSNITNPDLSTAEVISHVKDNPNTGVIQNVVVSDSTLQDIDLHGFMATDGTIENTKISGGSIDGATLTNIPYAAIDELDAHSADIADARIGQATITQAQVENLVADKAEINGKLTAAEGNISQLQANTADIVTIRANAAKVQNLTANEISAATGYISDLTSGNVTAQNIIADKAKLAQLDVSQISADHATIAALDSNYAHISNGVIDNATIGYADVNGLSANYAQANMANVNNAWITNGTIKDGAISSAMINDVSANKLTAGTINGSVINVTNLNADNITTGTINGQRIGAGSLSLDKLSEDVYTESEVDAMLDTMQAEIDGAIETWTGTDVPTLNNAPASSWTTAADRDKHVGDVYFNTTSGYNYRFTKSGTGSSATYSWLQIKDTDITNALQRIQTAEGQITQFDSDISTLKTDTGTLKTKTQSLETSLGDKVDTSTFNELSSTVGENSASITSMSTVLTNNGLTSSTNITNTVNTVSQTAAGNSSKISQLTTTLGTNADGTTKTGDIVHRTSAIEQDVLGFKQTVAETYATKTEAKQTASDSGKREIVTEDAAELPLLSLTAYGECSQDGTPTPDAPVPIKAVRGRNLLDLSAFTQFGPWARISNDNDRNNPDVTKLIPVIPGETYTMTFADIGRYKGIRFCLHEYTSTYASSDKGWKTFPLTFTVANNTNYIGLVLSFSETSETVTTSGTESTSPVTPTQYGEWLKVQLEQGTQATPYTPYDCIGVLSNGKNIFDSLNLLQASSWTKSGDVYSGTIQNLYSAGVLPIAPTTGAITISFDYMFSDGRADSTANGITVSIRYSDGTSSAVQYASERGQWSHWEFTVTSEKLAVGMRFGYVKAGAIEIKNVQVELGTEGTEYEPYRESVSYIDLQGHDLCSLSDDTQDVLTVDASGRVWIEQNVKRLLVNGSEHLGYGTHSSGTHFVSLTVPYAAKVQSQPLSDMYVSSMWTMVDKRVYVPSTTSAVFNNTDFTDLATARALFAANPVTLYYGLATPQTIDLGYIDPPITFDDGSVRIIAEIQPVIDASWWTKAGYDAGKAFNEGNTSADLSALEQRVTTAESSITQQAGQIASKVSQSDFSTLSGRVTTAESTITQQAGQIDAKVSKDGVIAAINLSTETEGGSTAKISASKVEIDGTAIFTAISDDVDDAITDKGYQTASQVDTAITSKGYATTGQAQGYANTAQANAIAAIPTDISDLNNDAGYQTSSDVSAAISTGTANLAAKADAIARTQRIYYRQTESGSAPGLNQTWLSTSGTGYGNWSLSIPQLTSGSTKYPKLYTAVQTQTVAQQAAGSTCSCSPVLLDDSTTVIDGGNIITGSVAANTLDVYDATIQKIRADAIDVEELRGYILQAVSLILGDPENVHIDASGTEMAFMNGLAKVAYIDAETGTFNMTRSVVLDDMYFGAGKWKWYKRSNNNMSVKWMGEM